MKPILVSILILAMSQGRLLAVGTPESLPILAKGSDVIILATVISATRTSSGGVQAQLQASAVLKGQLTGSSVTVELRPSRLMAQAVTAGVPFVEARSSTGLVFLKEDENRSFQVLPIGGDLYAWETDALLSMPAGWSPPANATLTEQLLSALIIHYRSLPEHGSTENARLIGSLSGADQSAALAVAEELIDSPIADERVMGLASAISLGSDEALTRLAKELPGLGSNKNLNLIVDAIYPNYTPHGTSSIAPLSALADLHPGIRGWAFAVVRALGRITNTTPFTPPGGPGPAVPAGPGLVEKDTLPAVIDLLDSNEPDAQLMAVRLISRFAQSADEEVRPSPEDLLRYWPDKSSNLAPADYASYWKTWWAQNRAKLGFPTN